jgi:hypothetical protein
MSLLGLDIINRVHYALGHVRGLLFSILHWLLSQLVRRRPPGAPHALAGRTAIMLALYPSFDYRLLRRLKLPASWPLEQRPGGHFP